MAGSTKPPWLEDVLKEADQLNEAEDPEETPFVSKYKARELLEKALDRLVAEAAEQDSNSEESLDNAARVRLQLGGNFAATEEPQHADEMFNSCLEYTKTRREAMFPEFLECNNQLGALWCNRGDHAKAMEFLQAALDAYTSRGDMESVGMDDAHTTTLFFLAQVYRHLDKPDLSGRYCLLTLKRQLQRSLPSCAGLDIREWCENAVQISGYHLGEGRYGETAHCLAAATAVMARLPSDPPPEDTVMQTRANINWGWAKLYVTKLKDDRERLVAAARGDEEVPPPATLDIAEETRFDIPGVDLVSIPKQLQVTVDGYETGAVVSKEALHWLGKTVSYYSLDGWVTEHLLLLEDFGSVYANLSFLSTDIDTRCKLCKRHTDTLEPVVAALSKEIYAEQIKAFSYNLAETFNQVLEWKIEQVEAKQKQHSLKRLMELSNKAIFYYDAFLAAHVLRGKTEPSGLDDPSALRLYLAGRFGKARVFGKALHGDMAGRRQLLCNALAEYKGVLSDAAKYNASDMEREMELCKEMTEMLPAKIAQLPAQAAAATQ